MGTPRVEEAEEGEDDEDDGGEEEEEEKEEDENEESEEEEDEPAPRWMTKEKTMKNFEAGKLTEKEKNQQLRQIELRRVVGSVVFVRCG